MSTFEALPLECYDGNLLRMNREFLKPYYEDLERFSDSQEYLHSLDFARKMLVTQEIKANNLVEGIKDDIATISKVVNNKEKARKAKYRRITNLYNGYQYILQNPSIDKEHLKELYQILSAGLLDKYAENYMGDYYRSEEVFILQTGYLVDNKMFEGADPNKIDYYMNQFFDYVNTPCEGGIEAFIKSQVMHFYFVYVHPYFDVNGRTSRTVAIWYLLNCQSYPFITFSESIPYTRYDYLKRIEECRKRKDVTLFLRYMFQCTKRELEKESIIRSINDNFSGELTLEEIQTLSYFLELKDDINVKNLIIMYRRFNDRLDDKAVYRRKIEPLIAKGILIPQAKTKGVLWPGFANFRIILNPELIRMDPSQIPELRLRRFLK